MDRIQILGVKVDSVTFSQAVERIELWLNESQSHCRFVVTPNLDHAVMLRDNPDFNDVYATADLVIADGMPLVWASRLLRKPIRERVAGSDLVPAILSRATPQRRLRVYLLGAAPGIAESAAARIGNLYPNVDVVGTFSPELGFEKRSEDNRAIVERVNATNAQLLVLGLGAPKQELWIHEHAHRLNCRVAVCAGATIDFLAQHRQRAPHWMQRTGTEWLYRALSEPRRLIPRYARDAGVLPVLLYQDWKATRELARRSG